jgi:hypothetical protein
VQQLGTLDRGSGRPARERLVRGNHGGVQLLGRRQTDGGECLLTGGVLDSQVATLAGDLLAANEQPGLQAV